MQAESESSSSTPTPPRSESLSRPSSTAHTPSLSLSPKDKDNATPSPSLSPTPPHLSKTHKAILLLSFSFAQFLDTINISALFSAIPDISRVLHLESNESVWLVSAYQLTFASFLLLSGRLADIYNTKVVFICGFASMGIISIGSGFVDNKIGLIVLRAFTGIAAATTVPSALHLIVHTFPMPSEQAIAISIFGACGAIGNLLGLVIGALFVQFVTWRWVFWLNACVSIPISALCILLIPNFLGSQSQTRKPQEEASGESGKNLTKLERLDVVGVTTITVAFILFIFAVTSASTDGWGSARVLAPLVISVAMVVGFFLWERMVPEDRAAVPPKMWFYTNFSPLFGLALLPFFWWGSIFLIFIPLWQEAYGWTPIGAAVRVLPMGLISFPILPIVGALQKHFRIKTLILFGFCLVIPGTLLLPFGDRKSRYWSIVFPAQLLGSAGVTIVFGNVNIGMFRYTPPHMAGTVGAALNSALQLGAAVGLAVVSSIESNVEMKPGGGGSGGFKGRKAAFWFLLAVVVVEGIGAVVFLKHGEKLRGEKSEGDQEAAGDTKNSEGVDMKEGKAAIVSA